jgi:NhaP-type Na+/H+ or K+/H+ antiporter
MSDQDENGGGGDSGASGASKVVAIAAAFAAAFVARKVLTFGWTKVTGKEPPSEQDPDVGWAEALGWAVVIGVGIQAARMLATRTVSRKMRHAPAGEIQQ